MRVLLVIVPCLKFFEGEDTVSVEVECSKYLFARLGRECLWVDTSRDGLGFQGCHDFEDTKEVDIQLRQADDSVPVLIKKHKTRFYFLVFASCTKYG